MNTEDIWNNFLSKIKSKVSLMSYNYIFKDLKLYSYNESKFTILVPNNELLLQNITKNYSNIIEDILNDITNDSSEVEFIFEKDAESNKNTTNEMSNKIENGVNIFYECFH